MANLEHIWLSPCSQYREGRLLHIGALVPFDDPHFGRFASLYAFWYWFAINREEHLRSLHTSELVKTPVQNMPTDPVTIDTLVEVNERRIVNTPQLFEALMSSTLPFKAYDVLYSNFYDNWIMMEIEQLDWYIQSLERIRSYYQPTQASL